MSLSTQNASVKSIRILLKAVELLFSLLLVSFLYYIGPYWILLFPILVVPIYGVYLIISRISIPDSVLGQSVPYLRYKAQVRAKSWLRADIAITLTVACADFGFGCVLFFGYFKTRSGSSYFLRAAVTSVVISFLYLIDAFLAVRQLNSASVQFTKEASLNAFATPTSKDLKVISPKQSHSRTAPSGHVQENVIYQPYQTQSLSQSQASHGPRKGSQMEIVKRKESSWFDEERKAEADGDNNFWIYHSYERQQQPEENHYLRVLKDSEVRHTLVDTRNRQGKGIYNRYTSDIAFMGSDDDLPPPPPPPIKTQISYKPSKFGRRVPVPPQRPTESYESASLTIPRVNIRHQNGSINLHQHGAINPPAYKARMIVVDDDETTFHRGKGSSSDGSTVRIDDVDKRSS